MDEPDESNREQKLVGREKARRHRQGSRSYLHAMTNSRVKRTKDLLERSDRRGATRTEQDDEAQT